MSRPTNELHMHECLRKGIVKLQDIKLHPNEMSVFDAANDDYIIEYKYRRPGKIKYDTLLLERAKFERCMEKAEKHNREFLYVCYYQGHIYIYNISKMAAEGYDFDWSVSQFNGATDLKDHKLYQQKIDKMVSMLPLDDATARLKVKLRTHEILSV